MGAFTWLSWLNQCVIMYSPHHLAVCDSFCVLLKKKIQSQCVCTKWCAKTGVQIRINYCFISNKNNHNWLIIEEVNVNWKWNWNKETEMNSNQRRSSSCKKRKRNTKTTLIELYLLHYWISTWFMECFILYRIEEMTMHNYQQTHKNSITRYANCSTKLAWLSFVCGFSLCRVLPFLHAIGSVFLSLSPYV